MRASAAAVAVGVVSSCLLPATGCRTDPKRSGQRDTRTSESTGGPATSGTQLVSPTAEQPGAEVAGNSASGTRALKLPELQPRLGEPLTGLNPDELERFRAGRQAFGRVMRVEDGLGPVYLLYNCVGCHNNPAGGSGTATITVFGRATENGYSELKELGGPLLQPEFINSDCVETVPEEANVVATRITTSVLGGGLIEALSNTVIEQLAADQEASLRGRVHYVRSLEDPKNAPKRIGKFGFKNHQATLLAFSAKAARDGLGLTNRFFPEEIAPNGDLARSTPCDAIPDPEIKPDASGLDYVDRITDFQRFLAPPPQTPRSGMKGEHIFERIGCAGCHVPMLHTIDDMSVASVLRGREVRAYSDFLLHDMGDGADGIQQKDAKRSEMRTTPLWGFRIRFPVFHDGRVTRATLAERAVGSIAWHRGQATVSRKRFDKLASADQDALVAFLNSLGRVEFDADGDNDVDIEDYRLFQSSFHGPLQGECTPEQRCAIVDVDQDADVDLADYALLQRAFSGPQSPTAMVVP